MRRTAAVGARFLIEALTTPGASFLGSGGCYDTVGDLPVPLMLLVMGQVASTAR